MTYDNADLPTAVNCGSGGATRTYSHDSLGRVTGDELRSNAGTVLAATSYTYDADDKIVGRTTSGTPGAGANSYGYDKAGRLIRWTAPGGAVTDYEWDAAGNRTRAATVSAGFDERNRLATNGTTTYSYTPRGTLAAQTQGGTTKNLTYDAFDRLTSDNGVAYGYDGLGRVAQRTAGANTTKFAYADDRNDPIAMIAGDGTTTARYGRTPDGAVLGAAENDTSALAVTNNHDDVVAGLNPNGASLGGATNHDPFGTILGHTGATTSLGYQGEYTDPTTDRVNMHARWYTRTPAGSPAATRSPWNPTRRCRPTDTPTATATRSPTPTHRPLSAVRDRGRRRGRGSSHRRRRGHGRHRRRGGSTAHVVDQPRGRVLLDQHSQGPGKLNTPNWPKVCFINRRPPAGPNPPGGGNPGNPAAQLPSLQQLRAAAIEDAAFTPAARAAMVAGVGQSLIDQIRDGVEKSVVSAVAAQATNGIVEVFAGENAATHASSAAGAPCSPNPLRDPCDSNGQRSDLIDEAVDQAADATCSTSGSAVPCANARSVPKGGIYALVTESGTVVRTGMAKNLGKRASQHARKYPDLVFKVLARTDSRAERRGLEEIVEHWYSPVLARQRAISLNHPRRQGHVRSALDWLQGN